RPGPGQHRGHRPADRGHRPAQERDLGGGHARRGRRPFLRRPRGAAPFRQAAVPRHPAGVPRQHQHAGARVRRPAGGRGGGGARSGARRAPGRAGSTRSAPMSDTTVRGRRDAGDDLPPAPPARGAGMAAWVGVFLVIGLVATLGALFIFTDAAIFRGRYIIATNVADAGGIRRGDPVQMRGVNIGRVQRFRIDQGGVEIRLEIEGEYPIPKDSRVRLASAGLLGGMVAEIIPGSSKDTVGYGDVLPGETEAGIAGTSEELAKKADLALTRVNELLSTAMIDNVHGSTAELRHLIGQISTTVAEQQRQLNTLTASLQR